MKHFLTLLALGLLAGCGGSTTDTPSPDGGGDASTDANSDASTDTLVDTATDTCTLDARDSATNTCAAAGGTCVAVTPTSSCPTGTHASTDAAIACPGVGATCCVPNTDGGTPDGGTGPEAKCLASGGSVGKALCCGSTSDFPDTCSSGGCGCAPSSSHEVKVCTCPSGKCFNGSTCVASGG